MRTPYQRFLEDLTEEFFADTAKRQWSWKQLATASDLSYSTIFRLGMRITRYPRLDTVFKIAKALGKYIETKKRFKRRYGKAA